jgi:hypothetical protein
VVPPEKVKKVGCSPLLLPNVACDFRLPGIQQPIVFAAVERSQTVVVRPWRLENQSATTAILVMQGHDAAVVLERL